MADSDLWNVISVLSCDMRDAADGQGDCKMSEETYNVVKASVIQEIRCLLDDIEGVSSPDATDALFEEAVWPDFDGE